MLPLQLVTPCENWWHFWHMRTTFLTFILTVELRVTYNSCNVFMNKTKFCCTMLHIWVIFPLIALKEVSSLILYKTKLTLSFCNGGAFHPKFILFPSPPKCIFYEEKGNCVALCCTFGWNSLCSRSKESSQFCYSLCCTADIAYSTCIITKTAFSLSWFSSF